MPTDHLTTVGASQLAAAVRAVLSGAELHTIAENNNLDLTVLDDSVHTYHAAGLAALEQRAERDWYDLRIQFADWATAEAVGATLLGPSLDQLQQRGELEGWWFLRKYPCWRLRLHGPDTEAVNHALDELTAAGEITRWWPTIYEPETAAFGGVAGMDTIHSLFCADSAGALNYLRGEPYFGRRELSLLLLNVLMRSAGLDRFERGDVFAKVAKLRPAPTLADDDRIMQMATHLRAFLVPDIDSSSLFAPGGPLPDSAPWLAAFDTAGHELRAAVAAGRLDRGLRAVLAHVLIFHWNRLGLSVTSQAVLSHAATTALLPHG